MASKRFVFDANVIISASLFVESVPRKALNKARADGKILLSFAVMTLLQKPFLNTKDTKITKVFEVIMRQTSRF